MDKPIIGVLHNLFGSRTASSLSRAGRNGPDQSNNSFATSLGRINDERNKVTSESIFCPPRYHIITLSGPISNVPVSYCCR